MAYVCVLILFLYVVVGFFLSMYHIQTPALPDGAWGLMSIFAGSYTIARGAEKFSSSWNYNRYNTDGGEMTPDDDFDDINEET
jgi:surface polysaccharide O-acyltransferase-like enzyme